MRTINPAQPKRLNVFYTQPRASRWNKKPKPLTHASYYEKQTPEHEDPFHPKYGMTQVLLCSDRRVSGRVIDRDASRATLLRRVLCERCLSKLEKR